MAQQEAEGQTKFDDARSINDEAHKFVESTREKMQNQIEWNEHRAGELRDQAALHMDAAQALRQFVYGTDVSADIEPDSPPTPEEWRTLRSNRELRRRGIPTPEELMTAKDSDYP